MAANSSLQSTPEGLVPVSQPLATPAPLSLGESYMLPPASPSAMAVALGKGPSLIRRVSRGAQGIPNRFRRHGHRDSSCGPVIMRRRSDSRGVADNYMDISDLELGDLDDEEAVEDLTHSSQDPHNALGITAGRPSVTSAPDPGVVAPIRSSLLQQGTTLTKVHKGKEKKIKFRMDFESAKVCWDSARLSKQFYIDDVRDFRIGKEARNYREENGIAEKYEPLWFTIIYSDSRSKTRPPKHLHLIAPTPGIFDLWINTLELVSRSRLNMMAGLVDATEKSAKSFWRHAMDKKFDRSEHAEEDETMDLQGVLKLCRSLHINTSENSIRSHFDKAVSENSRVLTQAQFLMFVKRLKERQDIKKIYKEIKSNSPTGLVDKSAFLAFLKHSQGVDVQADLEHWTNVFEKYARASKPKATASPQLSSESMFLTMSSQAFQAFLSSTHNSTYAPASPEPKFDRPLNEYFISSSHNTYLLGRQVAGESSTEAYITALQKGCRCIEVDCWDGSDGKPVVMHGRTLTKSIPFLDTIKVIAKYAFVSSPYPVIISLEVHCNPAQQEIMTQNMKAEFGDALLLDPLDDSKTLPSPEALKGKILVKVKAAAEDTDDTTVVNELTTQRRQRSFSSPFSRPTVFADQGPMLYSPQSISPPERPGFLWASPRTSTTSTVGTTTTTPGTIGSISCSSDESDTPHAPTPPEKKKKKNTSKITKVLGDLGVYTRGIKFSDFTGQDASTYNHVFSFAERTFDRLCKAEGDTKRLIEEHNMRAFMRVYPSGHRIYSSNFDPTKFWRRGVQMAALNWQTYDVPQQLNEAMFAAGNDRLGYVLKPDELRPGHFPVKGASKTPKKLVKFTVDRITAQQLPRPSGLSSDSNINPYIEFEMHFAEDKGRGIATCEGGEDASDRRGMAGIGEPVRVRTITAPGNGYDPEWQDTITMSCETRYPSLVFVRWTVYNSLDGRNKGGIALATFTAKLSSLQQGYRHLPLYDVSGEQYLFSTLFCRIKKEGHVLVAETQAPFERTLSSPGHMEPLELPKEGERASRGILKKLLTRTPSDRKKRKESESKERNGSLFSRSNTIERQ
ncbi:PLC-like phosphodiesterase [Lophium mytilinum]|uniref:Phosphoinositide phospholipase C n=1 Tax=Lophium mytilinum TaxID=390894 RepID=A0A6A6RDZ9_9PEZI|nr:PLC-like phosphodiesterase [Lophium mytilinum]